MNILDMVRNTFSNTPANMKAGSILTKDELASILKTNKKALEAFEQSYSIHSLNTVSDNFFEVNAKQAASEHEGFTNQELDSKVNKLVDKIVKEFVDQTDIYQMDGNNIKITESCTPKAACHVTLDELLAIPEEIRPQCAGSLMRKDISGNSYPMLLEMYKMWQETHNIKAYHLFRQGLDMLDLDPVTYQMIGMNPNTMGYWLPRISEAVSNQEFFKVPKTTIIRVPLCLLQLTRQEYQSLNRTTLDIVDRYCKQVFSLDENKSYFIKTGTYSSKYDFRNAKVTGAKEVRELGEYLLFIHFQALQMAAPLNNVSVYGVSTTNEWVVREFIEDKENSPCIYKGMPLHTEYRVFVDFDEQKVIGINPYWDPKVMKQHFSQKASQNPHDFHDYAIYSAYEETLMNRYYKNKQKVVDAITKMLPDVKLSGQWSIDIMQNGDDFYLIDMALAQNSALIECVPKELRKNIPENWIPEISDFTGNSLS